METTIGLRSDEAEPKNVVDGDDDLSVESVKAVSLPTFPFALVFGSQVATIAFVRAESGIDSDIFAGGFGKMLVAFLCFGLVEKNQTVLFYHFFLSGRTSPFRVELILNKMEIFREGWWLQRLSTSDFWAACRPLKKSTLEIHTLSGLPDELPTDWVKSD